MKENVCRVCGGKLKSYGTYARCEMCGKEYRIGDAMSQKDNPQTETARKIEDMMAQIAQLHAEVERLQASVATASQPVSAQPCVPRPLRALLSMSL